MSEDTPCYGAHSAPAAALSAAHATAVLMEIRDAAKLPPRFALADLPQAVAALHNQVHALRSEMSFRESSARVFAAADARGKGLQQRQPTAVIGLQTGRTIDLLNPDPAAIHIADIANALSRLCRFTGHTVWHYSVAQHSVYVSYAVPPEHALEALLHDATEAYIGDVSAPLKAALPDYRAIEQRLDAIVRQRFGLPCTLSPAVRQADLQLLDAEVRQLLPRCRDNWTDQSPTRWPYGIMRMTPEEAYAEFMLRFDELTGGEM